MHKRDILSPIAIVGLSIVFAIVSLAVFLSKGKSAFWISKKFKIGALLLTFTSLIACRQHVVTCYDVAPSNWITLDSINIQSNELTLDSSRHDTISGEIAGYNDSVYSYKFTDTAGIAIFKGDLQALDGKFDESIEKFKISMGDFMIPGKYILNFYASTKENQTETENLRRFNIRVIK